LTHFENITGAADESGRNVSVSAIRGAPHWAYTHAKGQAPLKQDFLTESRKKDDFGKFIFRAHPAGSNSSLKPLSALLRVASPIIMLASVSAPV
jgi:hypothetical protein